MKQIHFDEHQLKQFGEKATLSNFIDHLESDLEREGQVLCRVAVDGISLGEDDEARLSSIKLSTLGQIEIDIENSSDICSRVLRGWLETIPWLQEESGKLAEKLRFEGPEGQLKNFAELIESCSFLVQSLVSIRQQLGAAIDEVEWKRAESELRKVVNEVLMNFEKLDFVLLADLLEYDFCTALTAWHKLLAKVDISLGEEKYCG